VRAEPVSLLYSQGRVHHVGVMSELEAQMARWVPGEGTSPDRVDALVWGCTDLAPSFAGDGAIWVEAWTRMAADNGVVIGEYPPLRSAPSRN
jgi:hypothetical protein